VKIFVAWLSRTLLAARGLFGPALQGADAEGSDLDLLVDPIQGTTSMDIARVQNRLQKLLDVVPPKSISDRFPCERRSSRAGSINSRASGYSKQVNIKSEMIGGGKIGREMGDRQLPEDCYQSVHLFAAFVHRQCQSSFK
jgi:predicted nucleotidyltransferase